MTQQFALTHIVDIAAGEALADYINAALLNNKTWKVAAINTMLIPTGKIVTAGQQSMALAATVVYDSPVNDMPKIEMQ